MRTAGTTYFNLGPRLTLIFGALIVLILGGNAFVVWQFRVARNQTDRLTGANQQLIEVLRLQASLLSFHRRLDELARAMDAHRLVTEAEASRRALREQTQQIRTAIANLPSAKVVDPAFLPTLDTIDITLAAQVEDIFELAELGEWGAIQLRLANELNPVEIQTAILVNNFNQQASEDLARGVAEMGIAEHRILVLVSATALSTFFIATFFGWSIARHMIELQEEKFRETIESIPAMAFASLPDGYRTFVNKGWVEYTGMTVEQSLGSGWHAVIHPEDLKRVLGEWEAALASGNPMYYEARYRRAEDGQYRWFIVRVVPQRNKRGEIVKWFGTLTDIEDRKRAEQEREKLRLLEADLAHINRVSTLGEMAASLAHEIKQPIAATITSANSCMEWLAHDPPNLDRARAAAARIDKYGNRAAEIIDRIRSFYKKSSPQHELVDVNGVIEEILTLLKAETTRYPIVMRTELTAELPKIMADRVQLQQVFMNLMLNAIEAMTDSGGELTVKSQLQDGQLLFSISDTGPGLPKEKMDQIFSAFFTTKPQGSGMGLSISRSIVESHGGRLWATANNGRGATFHFTLPTAAEVREPAAGT